MSDESIVGASRRRFLASVSALAAVGVLAGCEGVEGADYEASAVGLSAEAQEELGFAEAHTDTVIRTVDGAPATDGTETGNATDAGDGADGDGDTTIGSQVVAYERSLDRIDEASEHRPTLVDSFVRQHDDVGSPAEFVPGGPIWNWDEAPTMSPIEGDETVDPADVRLLVPEGARSDGTVTQDEVLAMVPGSAAVDEVTIGGQTPFTVVSPEVLVPGGFGIGVVSVPNVFGVGDVDGRFWPLWWIETDGSVSPEDVEVVVATGDRDPEEVFGRFSDDVVEREVEAGETLDGQHTVFAGPIGDVFTVPSGWSGWTPEEVFDAGEPARLWGTNFGLSVLSTPDPQVGGEPINPLVEMDTAELLATDEGSPVGAHPYFDEIDDLELRRGYESTPNDFSERSPTILGEETAVESHAVVLVGPNSGSAWLLVTHAARVTAEDHVVVVGSQATPLVSLPPQDWVDVSDEYYPDWWAQAGNEFAATSGGRVE